MTVFYECRVCLRRHPGTESTPHTVKMCPAKPNEWVFVCWPDCETLTKGPAR